MNCITSDSMQGTPANGLYPEVQEYWSLLKLKLTLTEHPHHDLLIEFLLVTASASSVPGRKEKKTNLITDARI